MGARKLLAIGVTTATAVGIACSTGASASPVDDDANAITENAIDIANATIAMGLENASSPDISCGNATAEGSLVTLATAAHPVGTVDGNDVGNGTGQCISLQRTPFTAKLVTQIEYKPTGSTRFTLIPGCQAVTFLPATSGVSTPVIPEVTCNYAATSAYAGRAHRVHSILTNNLTANVYHGYSNVYTGGLGYIAVSVG
jgi:hypothetical protein